MGGMTRSNLFFFKLFFARFFYFDVDRFEVFTEFVTVLLVIFMFCFYGHEACGFYLPEQRLNPHLLH